MAVMHLRQIRQGEEIPRFSGVAWRNLDSMTVVVLPVPVNVLAKYARALWFWVKVGYFQPNLIERISDDGYATGRHSALTLNSYHLNKQWQQGYDEGQKAGISQAAIAFRTLLEKKVAEG